QPPRGAPPVGGRRLGAGRMLALPVSAGRRGHHVDSHAGMSTSVVTGTLRSTLGRVREMSTTKFVVALWFALLVPLQGYGQSQEGGLPVTNDRVTALEAAVAALQANLAAEMAARLALASDLANEIAARKAADTALQNAINNVQSNFSSAI